MYILELTCMNALTFERMPAYRKRRKIESEETQTVCAAMTLLQEMKNGVRGFAETALCNEQSRNPASAIRLAAKVEQASTSEHFDAMNILVVRMP